jgi:hypothetical protein
MEMKKIHLFKCPYIQFKLHYQYIFMRGLKKGVGIFGLKKDKLPKKLL